MAKAPSARVPKTSGQGISRLSYQKGYDLRNPKDTPQVKAKFSSESPKSGRGGGGKKTKLAGGINVSYGDTYFPSDIQDIEEYGKNVPKSKVKLSPTKGKALK